MKLLAQLTNPVLPSTLGGGLGSDVTAGPRALGGLIAGLIGLIFLGAFLFSFFILITGGIQWITSNGDKSGLEAARDKIVNALIGLIIVASVWAIMLLVGSFLGINLAPGSDSFTLPIPTLNGQNTPPSSGLVPPQPNANGRGPF